MYPWLSYLPSISNSSASYPPIPPSKDTVRRNGSVPTNPAVRSFSPPSSSTLTPATSNKTRRRRLGGKTGGRGNGGRESARGGGGGSHDRIPPTTGHTRRRHRASENMLWGRDEKKEKLNRRRRWRARVCERTSFVLYIALVPSTSFISARTPCAICTASLRRRLPSFSAPARLQRAASSDARRRSISTMRAT